MLHVAGASVSMCGYNTALDLLQSGCPSVLIPFDAGSEVEQTLRGQALAQLPGFEVIKSAALEAPRLTAALDRLLQAPRRDKVTTGFDGAAQTVRIVTKLRQAKA